MPVIHLMDGEKGGTGKSWVARTTVQGYIDVGNASGRLANAADVPFYGIEADRSNPTLSRFYGDCTQYVIFSEDVKFADEADELFDLALTHHLVVNLPAQVHVSLTRWMRRKGLIEYAAASGISLVKWFVSDGERDSLDVFLRSVEEFGTEIPHVFVKNYGRCDEWDYFEADDSVQAAIAQYKVKVIDFPELAISKRIPINAESMTSLKHGSMKGFPLWVGIKLSFTCERLIKLWHPRAISRIGLRLCRRSLLNQHPSFQKRERPGNAKRRQRQKNQSPMIL
jgi:hypothetical protein